MKSSPLSSRSLALYATLQSLAMAGCWVWFIALGLIAYLNFSLEQMEWWILTIAACAGLYGLRPNLEKAIDRSWVGDTSNAQTVLERIAQLRPIKRRIDLVFSIAILVLVLVAITLWYGGMLNSVTPVHTQ